MFNTLIEDEDEHFLGSKDLADDVARIAHITSSSEGFSVQTVHVMVEMLFSVAAKIKLNPKYLRIWFGPKYGPRDSVQGDPNKRPHTSSDKQDFPLFYFLLNYIHLNDGAGEFSRTGLIYIIEIADRDETLERWIIESDLATLMASGLGALYSQMGRKLCLSQSEESAPAILALSDRHKVKAAEVIIVDSSHEFDQNLGAFLNFLAFWQDILEYCGSVDVRQTLLDHFEHIFMQQLFYPSMLESSDKDGGSSVAIMTYTRFILESITHPELIAVFLRFLLPLYTKPQPELSTKVVRPATLARRRKSQNLLDAEARSQDRLVPDLFSLTDLIFSSLQSSDQQTLAATLQLVSMLLLNQYNYAMPSLLHVQQVLAKDIKYSLSIHTRNLNDLDDLATTVLAPKEAMDSTELYIQDAQNLIESHCTANQMSQLPINVKEKLGLLPAHTISSRNPFTICLCTLIGRFFSNEVQTNLSLTQTIITLACCGQCSLEGWLLTECSPQDKVDVGVEAQRASHSVQSELPPTDQNPTALPEDRSPIFTALNKLANQVSTFREEIPDFDTHLSEQRHAFNIWDQMAEEYSASAQRQSKDSSPRPQSTLNTSNVRIQPVNSIYSHLRSSEQSPLGPSRSESPRGRHLHQPPLASNLAGKLSQLRPSSTNLNPLRLESRSRSSAALSPTRQPQLLPALSTIGGIIPHRTINVPISLGHAPVEGQKIQGREQEETKEVPLRRILTNVIILHDFILELMAVVQVRASVFGEVIMD